jgi:glycosyltransferase involved in cell wall biosynthesis
LRAFAAARSAVKRAALVLVGDGPERPGLEAIAAELGVADAVRFAGARSDVPRLLRLFDVFALSSQTEGISVALLEAMAAGLPAVATAVGGNPEVVVEGETGRLVPAGDPARLGEALASLLADPDRRQAWGQAGRARVMEKFTLDRMVRDYEAIYESLAGRR